MKKQSKNTKKAEASQTSMQIGDRDAQWFKRLEECGVLRNELASLGWGFWPKDQNDVQMGFFDEWSLRKLADEIERRNKPFWDEYNASQALLENTEPAEEGIVFPDELFSTD